MRWGHSRSSVTAHAKAPSGARADGAHFADSSMGVGPFMVPAIILLGVLLGASGLLRPQRVVALHPQAPARTSSMPRRAVTEPPVGMISQAPAGEGRPTLTPGRRGSARGATEAPKATSAVYPALQAPREPWHRVGGIDLADSSTSLSVRYPTDLDGASFYELEGLRILLSDDTGESLRRFNAMGQWPGSVFIYPDSLGRIPVVSMHDGYYAGRQLEAEPLRHLIEGPLGSPHDLATIEGNLQALVGLEFQMEQGGRSATLRVAQATRMDAATVDAYSRKAGELSALLAPTAGAGESVLLLICSARQPGEPDTLFPGRYVLELRLLTH